jgi:hypothetical protein
MNDIVDIEMLPLRTGYRVLPWCFDYDDPHDYPRWFRYQGQLYSLRLMMRSSRPGWDFETVTSESNGTVLAAVLDEKTVRVGRIPHGAGDN